MARPLRLEYPGALFHVTCRGNEKQAIFRDDSDRRHFLDLLGRCVNRFDWILSAYVLMLNHFHLVVQLTAATLSRGLHWVNGEYVRYFNERYARVGHLLQGRPHTPLVDKQTYYLEVLRYDVLNPVRARIAATPDEYEWSSHRAVIGDAVAPGWLAVDDVLAQFGDDREVARARYRCFVDAGIGIERSPWQDLVGQVYLGSGDWLDSVREKIALKPRADEHPRSQRSPGTLPMSEIVSAVAHTLRVVPDRVRHAGVPRGIAAWLAWNEGLLTHREIAAGLRLRSSGYVSRLIRAFDHELSGNEALQRCVDETSSTLRGKKEESKA